MKIKKFRRLLKLRSFYIEYLFFITLLFQGNKFFILGLKPETSFIHLMSSILPLKPKIINKYLLFIKNMNLLYLFIIFILKNILKSL